MTKNLCLCAVLITASCFLISIYLWPAKPSIPYPLETTFYLEDLRETEGHYQECSEKFCQSKIDAFNLFHRIKNLERELSWLGSESIQEAKVKRFCFEECMEEEMKRERTFEDDLHDAVDPEESESEDEQLVYYELEKFRNYSLRNAQVYKPNATNATQSNELEVVEDQDVTIVGLEDDN